VLRMNKFAVVLSSLVDGATVSIQVLVNSDMSAKQLTTYYKCKSITISDVYVEQL
jgi:hypothetical protein